MPDEKDSDENRDSAGTDVSSGTLLRRIAAWIAAGIVIWQVIVTEMRVEELRSQGMPDFVMTSERLHAYLPLIGAAIGVLGLAWIVKTFRRSGKS